MGIFDRFVTGASQTVIACRHLQKQGSVRMVSKQDSARGAAQRCLESLRPRESSGYISPSHNEKSSSRRESDTFWLRLAQIRHICFREVKYIMWHSPPTATTTPAMTVPMVSTKNQNFGNGFHPELQRAQICHVRSRIIHQVSDDNARDVSAMVSTKNPKSSQIGSTKTTFTGFTYWQAF